MSEEVENTNDGTWSGLKKTIVGTVGTIVTAGGVWLTTLLGGGDKAEPAPAQAQPVINLNMTNNNTQQQSAGGGKTVIIKEKTAPAAQPQAKPKKKEGDEFKEEAPKW
jgi:hypothetical protein